MTGSVGEVDVDPALDADPVCIRCGRGLTLYTDTSEVSYSRGGSTLTNAVDGVEITNEGLILEDPAENTNQIRCDFTHNSNPTFNVINIEVLGKQLLPLASNNNNKDLVCTI